MTAAKTAATESTVLVYSSCPAFDNLKLSIQVRCGAMRILAPLLYKYVIPLILTRLPRVQQANFHPLEGVSQLQFKMAFVRAVFSRVSGVTLPRCKPHKPVSSEYVDRAVRPLLHLTNSPVAAF